VTLPAEAGETDFDPLVDCEPDQSASLGVAVAAQDVAFALDQVSVTAWPTVPELAEAERVTLGAGRGVEPPPQPLALRRHNAELKVNSNRDFFMTPPQGRIQVSVKQFKLRAYLVRREIHGKTGTQETFSVVRAGSGEGRAVISSRNKVTNLNI